MKRPLLRLCSLILLLAAAGCQSLSPAAPAVLLKPNQVKVPALPDWIRQAAQQPPISTDELQLILNGCGRPGARPSPGCKPASAPTMP